MRRAFAIGACIGVLVFVQGAMALRGHATPLSLFEKWALACAGVFGITLSSIFTTTTQAWVSLSVAAVALVFYYASAAALLWRAYRWRRNVGVAFALLTILIIHVTLYLWVLRSMVA